MHHSIELPEKLFKDVSHHASVSHRTLPEQAEHWMRLGKIVEDNPDLPYDFIKRILIAEQEVADGDVTEYTFD